MMSLQASILNSTVAIDHHGLDRKLRQQVKRSSIRELSL